MNFKEYLENLTNLPLLTETVDEDPLITTMDAFDKLKMEFIKAILEDGNTYRPSEHFLSAGRDKLKNKSASQMRHQIAVNYLTKLRENYFASSIPYDLKRQFINGKINNIDDMLRIYRGDKGVFNLIKSKLFNFIPIYPVIKNIGSENYNAIIFDKAGRMIEVVAKKVCNISRTNNGGYTLFNKNIGWVFEKDHYFKLVTAYVVADKSEHIAYAVKFADSPVTKPVSDLIVKNFNKNFKSGRLNLAEYQSPAARAAIWAEVKKYKKQLMESEYYDMLEVLSIAFVEKFKNEKEKLKNLIVSKNGILGFNQDYLSGNKQIQDAYDMININARTDAKQRETYSIINTNIHEWLNNPNVPIETIAEKNTKKVRDAKIIPTADVTDEEELDNTEEIDNTKEIVNTKEQKPKKPLPPPKMTANLRAAVKAFR